MVLYSIFSLMFLSSCHIHRLRAKKGSFLSSSRCRGVENQKDVAVWEGGRGRIFGPGWSLRSLNIHAEEERSTLPNFQLHHIASHRLRKPHHPLSISRSPPCFSLTFPSFPIVSHTHTVYNLWRLTQAGMHTHTKTPAQLQNHTSAKILTHSIQGLSRTPPSELTHKHWLCISADDWRKVLGVSLSTNTHSHTHTGKQHTLSST